MLFIYMLTVVAVGARNRMTDLVKNGEAPQTSKSFIEMMDEIGRSDSMDKSSTTPVGDKVDKTFTSSVAKSLAKKPIKVTGKVAGRKAIKAATSSTAKRVAKKAAKEIGTKDTKVSDLNCEWRPPPVVNDSSKYVWWLGKCKRCRYVAKRKLKFDDETLVVSGVFIHISPILESRAGKRRKSLSYIFDM